MANDNTLPVITHLLGLLTGFLGPLIILLVSEKQYDKDHAKLALNWHFSTLIYYFVSAILMLVLIGFVLMAVVGILSLVFGIMAAVRASDGKLWPYPMSIKFFKVEA